MVPLFSSTVYLNDLRLYTKHSWFEWSLGVVSVRIYINYMQHIIDAAFIHAHKICMIHQMQYTSYVGPKWILVGHMVDSKAITYFIISHIPLGLYIQKTSSYLIPGAPSWSLCFRGPFPRTRPKLQPRQGSWKAYRYIIYISWKIPWKSLPPFQHGAFFWMMIESYPSLLKV